MRIAVISTSVFPCPPKGYSGLEMIAWLTAKGLAEKGHDVALVAPDGSECPGCVVIPTGPAGQWDERATYGGYGYQTPNTQHLPEEEQKKHRRVIEGYWKYLPQFDCVIDHSWSKWSYMLKAEGKLKTPVLGVMHAPINTMWQQLPPVEKPCIVCISKDQAAHFEAIHNQPARVCYNGCFDGDTLLTLENGKKEKLGGYVARSGRERVLAWSEQEGRFVYSEVQETFNFPAANDFIVEIKVQHSSELTLLSTPDNLIMTRDGWKSAFDLSTSDEVLYGEEAGRIVDRGRTGVCAEVLRKEEVGGDSGEVGKTNVFHQQHSDASRTSSDTTIQAGAVDGRGVGDSLQTLSRRILRGVGDSPSESHTIRNSRTSSREGVASSEGGFLQEVLIGGAESYSSNGCCISCRADRWRGSCVPPSRQETVHSRSCSQHLEHRQEDKRFHQEMVTCDGMAGGSEKSRSKDHQSSSCDAFDCHRIDCGGCAETVRAVHDCQKEKSGEADRILRDFDVDGVEIKVYGEADRVVPQHTESEFTSWKKVVSVRRLQSPPRVFDLKTSTGNFVANGVVVHNCDLNFYKPLSIPRTERFLFLARFSTIKGPLIAINSCREVGAELDLIGDTTITGEPEYYEQCRRAADGKQIRIVGGCSRGETVWWYSQAHAFCHPNKLFREPLGLAPLEAQAAGLPVICFDNGAMRETVRDGETGSLCKTEKEFTDSVRGMMGGNCITEAVRKRCQENAAEFSVQKMVSRYESLCVEAIEGGGW